MCDCNITIQNTSDTSGSSDPSSPEVFSNKTITDPSNNVIARGLWDTSGGSSVSVYLSPAPAAGYILTAVDSTTAQWLPPAGVSGSPEFEKATNINPITTTIPMNLLGGLPNGGVQAINWTTGVKSAGTFRFGWSYNWTSASNISDFICCITVDNVIQAQLRSGVQSTIGGSDTDDFAIPGSNTNQRQSASGFFYIVFGASSTHQVVLTFGRSVNPVDTQSVSISNIWLELWKVA